MQLGVHLPHIGRKASPENIRRAAEQAEDAAGVDEHDALAEAAPIARELGDDAVERLAGVDRIEDDAVAAREQALWDKARPRYDAIMERHVRPPPEEDDVVDVDADVAPDARRRKRLVYRSKQRGWLEVDLLLGTWASINVPSLNADELDEFEKFVNMETIDIYNVLTLRSDVPEEMGGGVAGDGKRSLVERIQDWCKESPLGKADKEKYDEVKTKNNLI